MISREEALDVYQQLRTIRSFEERLDTMMKAGKLAGFLHLYVGQEAVAVGVCSHLNERDYVSSNHRGHGHCIAKGVDLRGMMAELFGRQTGICKGKGGSMHIADIDLGMIGANGIVGAGIPLTVGAALTASIKKTGGVAIAFFGDGATNQGQFHEALNLAATWKLPAVFILENNGYGEATPLEFAAPMTDLAVRAKSYAMHSLVADGMDFFDVFEKAGEAIERARNGEGPTLVECKTYRFLGHFVGDPIGYRSDEELNDWKENRDPLPTFEEKAIEMGLVSEEALRRIDAEVTAEIDAAVEAAEAAPFPSPEDVLTDVYVTE
ncbi:MAG: thiamine pyrophosphate-dependent dehydrogenase E1 component subunit alpha [Candidatus Binatia bacterium]|nr:thiamine pyrophosphate-dependent dehydrogenase E1 component subunit alpha [Candidatus Binatia bacterium]